MDKIRKCELPIFFEILNQQYPSIKFEMKYSKDKIEFLDTLIYKDKDNNIKLQTVKAIYTQNQPDLFH